LKWGSCGTEFAKNQRRMNERETEIIIS
jgi:hypothetical protein